jgi:hypothetical protein
MNKGGQQEDHIENSKNNDKNTVFRDKWHDQRTKNDIMGGMHPNNMMFQNFEQDASSFPSYPQMKAVCFMEPRCRYEQFELTEHVAQIVMKFQEQARHSPETIEDNKLGILVYWPDDKLWYY